MKSARKFLFDACFDDDRAALVLPKTSGGRSVVSKPVAPTYGPEELAAARAEGFAAGRAEGLNAAKRADEHAATEALDAIAKQLPSLQEAKAQADHRRTEAAIELALTVVRKLFPGLVRRHALAEIEAFITECLHWLREEPRIIIRVADRLLDPLKRVVPEIAAVHGFAGKIVVLSEPDMATGDARVEWADGGAERNSEWSWSDIEHIIASLGRATEGVDAPGSEPDHYPASSAPSGEEPIAFQPTTDAATARS